MILSADYTPGTETGKKNLKKIDPSRKMPSPFIRIGSLEAVTKPDFKMRRRFAGLFE
jgi:hypothetical protein